MRLSYWFRSAALLIALSLVGEAQATGQQIPEITAQGFDLTEMQQGELGNFGRLRVRFEVPNHIKELRIKERSYEVDLARTSDTANFELFGLSTTVRQLSDVTLNFETYINRKLETKGDYAFELQVTDREGRSAAAQLRVHVAVAPAREKQSSHDLVETAPFRFTRIGASDVSGADDFGITWRTIESNTVIIEISRQPSGASKLIKMALSDYEEISTKEQLSQKTATSSESSPLHLPTANGQAADSVFALINQTGPYLFKITGSSTSLSELGTTVTLTGEYKH